MHDCDTRSRSQLPGAIADGDKQRAENLHEGAGLIPEHAPDACRQAEPILVSVCIVNWNCHELLRGCLESLAADQHAVPLEVIVVDNGSKDGAPDMVAQEFPDVILIRNDSNRGFSRANNQAASCARGRYLFFLNNDTIVPSGALEGLVDYALAHPRAGIVGPRLREPGGRIQVSYRLRPTVPVLLHRTSLMRWTGIFRRAYQNCRRQACPGEQTAEVEVLMGAAMLIPRDVFEAVGGWDEDFTFGGEDIDLSSRIGLEHQVVYHPDVEIVHFGRSSTRQHIGYAVAHTNAGFLRFLRKSGANRRALLAYKIVVTCDLPVQIAIRSCQFAFRRLTGDPGKARQTALSLRGLVYFLCRGLPEFWRA